MLAPEPHKFELCIRKKDSWKDEELEQLSLLLKIRINLCSKQICFKIFKQKVRLKNKSLIYQYLFCVFFI